jgi:hypothetical protein
VLKFSCRTFQNRDDTLERELSKIVTGKEKEMKKMKNENESNNVEEVNFEKMKF